MLKFPSIDQTPRGEGHWAAGPDVTIDPRHIIAVEPKVHRYHSYRPAQPYALVHLSTGTTVEVFMHAEVAQGRVAEAMAEAANIRAGLVSPHR